MFELNFVNGKVQNLGQLQPKICYKNYGILEMQGPVYFFRKKNEFEQNSSKFFDTMNQSRNDNQPLSWYTQFFCSSSVSILTCGISTPKLMLQGKFPRSGK